MTAYNCLTILAISLVVIGCGARLYAEGDVTIVPAATAKTQAASSSSDKSDDTPVIHKSLHKKKKPVSPTTPAPISVPATSSSSGSSTPSPASKKTATSSDTPKVRAATPPAVAAPTKTVIVAAPATPTHLSATTVSPSVSSAGPTVETGLPVARRNGTGGGTDPAPIPVGSSLQTPSAYRPLTSTGSATVNSLSSTSMGSYSPTYRALAPTDNFVFANFTKVRTMNYPWHSGIITTIFWIGEGSTTISNTDNMASAWDSDWRTSNRGTDNPYRRNGYAPADHAPTVNPFYVALPFNDLAYPDKARRWLPEGWHRPPKDGKQVSACKDRWVQIRNAQGRSCYAQWEDVGPLTSDHAEYVFGSEKPDTYTRAGLDVSPAVATYLGIDSTAITSWHFVDDADVRPGDWLKYDELALLYKAMHEQKPSAQPIQRNSEPIDDSSDDSNKKRVGAAKG